MKFIQIRRHLLGILMMLAISLWIFGVCYAADESVQVSLSSPGAHQVYKPGDTVEISGTAQGLAEVSIAVRNEQGILVFTAQPQVQGGAFTTGFTLNPAADEGQYTINVGSLGLPELKTYRFEVRSTGGAVIDLTKPSAGEEFKPGDIVEIAGTAQRTDAIAICVRNSKSGRVYVAQPPVVNGNFTTRLTLAADAVAGDYTIVVTGDGLAAAQTYQFAVASTGGGTPGGGNSGGGTGGGGIDPNDDLFISGDGVANEISFSLDELAEMDQERVLFSATNDWPQDLFVAAEGVPLRTLLDQAEMRWGAAKKITFKATDGYRAEFTVDELFNQTRYKFPDQITVEPLIALKRAEGSSSFGSMTGSETPVLCYGQRAQTEQTLLGFVKYLNSITVSTNSPGQWSEPTAKIIAPGSKQKVATQGGQVESGSEIVLVGKAGAIIYYTTDGSEPNLNSKIYNVSGHTPELNEPIPVNANTTIKAKAVGRGQIDSDIVTFKFTVTGGSSAVVQQTIDENNIQKEELTLENGRKREKITLLPGTLDNIENGEQGSRLAVTSTAAVDEVVTKVPAAVLKKAQEKGMLMGINSAIGYYTLPLNSLDLNKIASELGEKPEELNLQIYIFKATDEDKNKLAAHIRGDQKMPADPVGFRVEITASGDKKATYNSFGKTYVEREIPLTGDFNAGQAIGVVWHETQGQFQPLPTRFETRDGQNIAVILNRTNSLYTVLQSNKTFTDIQDNWAKEDIELLANKMLISGKTATTYAPGSNITRAEFAALLVRALGLEEGKLKEGRFKDVTASDWYAGSVAAATQENIIGGYEGNLFKPGNNITRQEMAAMIMRAARVVGKEDTLLAEVQARQLAQFKDQSEIASWAAQDVALAVKAGIITGMAGGDFSPQTNADRAQSAAILKRFLTYVNFISANQPENQQTDNHAANNN